MRRKEDKSPHLSRSASDTPPARAEPAGKFAAGIVAPPSSPRRRWWLGLNLGLVFALGAILGWREIGCPDIGFHLSSGRWIVEHKAVPQTDPFSYTMSSHRYIDLQWLFQLALYGAHQLGGTALILAGKIALTFAYWALLLARSIRREGQVPLSGVLLLVLVALGDFWEERPQLFSWVYGSLVFWILEARLRGNRRWLPALPAIMLLWVNTHSLFVLGLVIIGVHALWELRNGGRSDRRLLVFAALSGAVCLANPYHIHGLLLPLTQFQEIQQGHVFKDAATGVSEFQSPFRLAGYLVDDRFVLFQPGLGWQLYAVLALVGLMGGWKRVRVPELVLGALFFCIFWQASKNFGYFVMATFPLVATGLDVAGAALRRRFLRDRGRIRQRIGELLPQVGLGAVTVICLLLGGLAWTGQFYKLGWSPNRCGTGFNAAFLPVNACRFLQEHRIQGRVLNTFAHGGYIYWVTRQPVFIYGITEVTGPYFYREYIESKTPEAFPQTLRKWQPTIAVVPFTDTPYWLYRLSNRKDWRLVQHDDWTALFLHESVGQDIPAQPPPEPGKDYRIYPEPEISILLRNAASRPAMTLREWPRGSDAYPLREIRLSGFYLHSGNLDACTGYALEGLEKSRLLVPDLFLNLGHVLNARKQYELADFCFNIFLRNAHDPVIADEIQAVRSERR
jgi:hypothetical protein